MTARTRWGYADNEEGPFRGDFETREEAVAEGLRAAWSEREAVWVACGHEYPGSRYLPMADHVLEHMNDCARDNGAGDEWDGINVTPEAAQELVALLRAWAGKHVPWAGFWETSGRAECVRKGTR